MRSTSPEPKGVHLTERLRDRIAEGGPITFADFMEAALYDPEEGFYARMPIGEEGHFVTSPHLSPVYGRLVARQVAEFWELLGRPAPFAVVEVGAGDGTLAHQILKALHGEIKDVTRYTAVELGAGARRALQGSGIETIGDLGDLEGPVVGSVIANELLDNLPFHRLRGTPDGPTELYVGDEGDRFVLVEGPLSSPALSALAPALEPGAELVVSLAALDFVDQATAVLDRGYVWLVDYGFAGEARPQTVHGYRDHGVHEEVLTAPGSTDITAGVDFAALVRHATGLGLHVWGPVSQRNALLSLGFRELDEQAQARQVEALNARLGIEAMRIYSDRNRANLLLGRQGLGAAWVLCLGKDAHTMPQSVRPR